ncbi:DUF1413 domain-containing protein [Ferdinandcohnia sp. SAFN-114]|uniref:DUF1413 domain-containing protein n=1 Tax=Ferdinandcohnia sp. SAFN-114 TaxID=3387275 RepID=UPI003F7FCDCD
MKIDINTSLEELLVIAKDTIKEIEKGEEFIVKELFRGFEWNRIGKGNRTKLGAMFFNFAENEGKQHLKGIGKTPQNQQKYRKL